MQKKKLNKGKGGLIVFIILNKKGKCLIMNTYYLVKSAKGKTIFLIFYHSFYIIFVDIFFLNIYIKTKLFLLIMKKNPENYTINDVFKYIGDHTFMSLQKQKYVLNIE